MHVRAEIQVPHTAGRGRTRRGTVLRFNNFGDNVTAYSIDSAMDTDTDAWTIQMGITKPGSFTHEVMDRDAEVRVNIFGLANGRVETLHSGFADEIVLDHENAMTINGRDITSVAVDSQHPPTIWHGVRPHVLVAREARQLKIGDRLKLTKAAGFKTYATDGSESYWQVWYRFFRKRRMWVWAEPDGSIIASPLHYNQPISYTFGRGGIPVERLEWRSNKQQRVGEVFMFGHRGDIGFVASADDPSTRNWIKRPTVITTSGDVHNQAEARVEAWEEIFESKVGAVEIKLLIRDPGFVIRQNTMARVDLPIVGLRGDFYIVGTQIVGSIQDGLYQQIRLREKAYAISRRVPSDPHLKSGTTANAGGIAANLDIGGPTEWSQFFVRSAQKFHGPWNFQLFLGVLLSIADIETGFHNYRRGGNIDYPGTKDGTVPSLVTQPAAYNKFVATFANVRAKGHVKEDYAVGVMQLLTLGYKLYADRLFDSNMVGDEFVGGRWDPESNIMAGGAVLASKLGAGWTITADGKLVKTKVTGVSLQPTEENMWAGVAAYGEGAAYAKKVKQRYEDTYKAQVEAATAAAKQDAKETAAVPTGTSAELRKRILNNTQIEFLHASQSDDIRYGLIHDEVMLFMLWFAENGWPEQVYALKSDHNKYTSENRISAHGYGLAIDLSNYNSRDIQKARRAMEYIAAAQPELKFEQLIGPDPALVINGLLRGPAAGYDAKTLGEHKSHIHVGWPLSLARK